MAIQERDNSVTIAKALAIMLMVLQHSGCPVWLNHYVRIFIMPLFFFMSGYCFKTAYLDDFKSFMKRRIKGIYWPIFKWSIVFVLLHNIFYFFNIYNGQFGAITKIYNLSDYFYKLIQNVVLIKNFEPLLGGYWFMNSLLWGSLFFFVVLKLLKNVFVGGVILLLLTFFAALFHLKTPYFDISAREFMAAFFIMCGHAFAKYKIRTDISWFFLCVLGIIVGIGSWILAASMLHFNHLTLVPYVFSALCGVYMTFCIAKKIQRCDGFFIRLITYGGNHTLDILTWHFLSFKIVSLLIIVLYGLEMAKLAELPVIREYAIEGWWILFTIVGTLVPLLGRYLYENVNNYFSNQILCKKI